jgi:hypothetical protein
MNQNDVVSIITPVGEFVGRFGEQCTNTKVIIKDPRMLIQTQQGMGFARGVCVTGEENPKEVEFYTGGLVFITKSNSMIEKAYIEATSGIILQ